MTLIADYGVGNLFSLKSSFAAVGEEAAFTSDPEELLRAERVILPGVGAFGDAAEKLRAGGLSEAICTLAKKGTPLMGICLGMQLLFDKSLEYGEHSGLGLIPGTVSPLEGRIPAGLKIPKYLPRRPCLLRSQLLCRLPGGVHHRNGGVRRPRDRLGGAG